MSTALAAALLGASVEARNSPSTLSVQHGPNTPTPFSKKATCPPFRT